MTPDPSGLVLHRGLEEHAPRGRVAPDAFDEFVRLSVLFNRGLVVTDSDLNNNPLFHAVYARGSAVFDEALRDGHLLRAGRIDDHGDVASQAQIYRNLQRRNAVRAAPVPAGYPAQLDDLLKHAPTLTWSSDHLTTIFHVRCIASLERAVAENELTGPAAELANDVVEFLKEFPAAGAADVEQRFHVQHVWPDRTWQQVWRVILDAWGGNVAYAFDGALVVAQSAALLDRMNPSGPSAPEELVAQSATYYEALRRGEDEQYGYLTSAAEPVAEPLVEPVAGPTLPSVGFRLDRERLMALSLRDVAKLRESAGIDDLLDLRARALRSPHALESMSDELTAAALGYWDRLASKDLAVELMLDADADAAASMAALERKRERDQARVTLSRTVAGQIPGVGILVALLDAGEAVRTLLRHRRDAPGDFDRTTVHRIPDFRVIERLAVDKSS